MRIAALVLLASSVCMAAQSASPLTEADPIRKMADQLLDADRAEMRQEDGYKRQLQSAHASARQAQAKTYNDAVIAAMANKTPMPPKPADIPPPVPDPAEFAKFYATRDAVLTQVMPRINLLRVGGVAMAAKLTAEQLAQTQPLTADQKVFLAADQASFLAAKSASARTDAAPTTLDSISGVKSRKFGGLYDYLNNLRVEATGK